MSQTTPAFRDLNLIYGWNGCGKTTFTRLFDTIATSSEATIQYEAECDDGTKYTATDAFPTPIRVFNQDYIQSNVRLLEAKASAISIILGAENRELLDQIEADEKELNGDPSDALKIGKVAELQAITGKKEDKVKANNNAFTAIARTIGAELAGSGAASRQYRRPDAERDFAAISEPKTLADEELDKHAKTIKQEEVDPENWTGR